MVQDQPTPDPEGVPPRVEAVDDRRQWPIPVPCSLAVRRGCKGDLRIAHALRCLVLTELVRHPPEVLRVNETGPHGSVLNEEIAKARDDTAVARKTIWQRDGCRGPRGWCTRRPQPRPSRMTVCQLAKRRWPNSVLEMDVDVRLRQGREIAHPGAHRKSPCEWTLSCSLQQRARSCASGHEPDRPAAVLPRTTVRAPLAPRVGAHIMTPLATLRGRPEPAIRSPGSGGPER